MPAGLDNNGLSPLSLLWLAWLTSHRLRGSVTVSRSAVIYICTTGHRRTFMRLCGTLRTFMRLRSCVPSAFFNVHSKQRLPLLTASTMPWSQAPIIGRLGSACRMVTANHTCRAVAWVCPSCALSKGLPLDAFDYSRLVNQCQEIFFRWSAVAFPVWRSPLYLWKMAVQFRLACRRS